MLSIALCGNPNVGKTRLFNRITRSDAHEGNWHGVTVGKAEKTFVKDKEHYLVKDLPGLYSLTVFSSEEQYARDEAIYGNNKVVCVAEARNLVRNLCLALQLKECGRLSAVVINMADELKKTGKGVDGDLLSARLGVPVVITTSDRKKDRDNLVSACESEVECVPPAYLNEVPFEKARCIVSAYAKTLGVSEQYLAVKLLENDAYVKEKLSDAGLKQAETLFGDYNSKLCALRYAESERLMCGVIYDIETKGRKTLNPDKFLLNKFCAAVFFLAIMALIFALTFSFVGKPLSDGLQWLTTNYIYIPIKAALSNSALPLWATLFITDGIINAIFSILVFLPQVTVLFVCLSLLEESGYISRVAFMTDGFFRKIGLSGRAAFTIIMGFGCSATAVLTARGLEDANTRKKAVLLTPLIPCGARLPVITALLAAYFSMTPLIIFALYSLSVIIVITLCALAERTRKLKSGNQSFIMEMPPYRLPSFYRIGKIIVSNVKQFLLRVATVVFSLNCIVWLLSNFSFTHGFVCGTSYPSAMQSIAGAIAPLFAPIGCGNWRAVAALMSGLVAKETVIASLNALGGVTAIFTGQYVKCSVAAFTVFTLLYTPCFATLAAVSKEIGKRYAILSFFAQFAIAYIVAIIVYYVGIAFAMNFTLALSVTLFSLAAIAALAVVAVLRTKEEVKTFAAFNAKTKRRKT